MSSQKISIVTVTFNCENSIENTIKSVLSQCYPNIEYIVIDGLSKDNTMSIIKKYENRISCLISERDRGIYDAMNKGIERATGEWILFFNSADVFCNNNVLSEVAKYFDEETDVIWGDYKTIIGDKVITKKCTTPFFKNTKKFHGMGFSHQSVLVRTRKAKELMFDLSYRCCADYNMMMQLYKNGAKFKYCNTEIAIVEGGAGFSYNNSSTQMKDVARILGIEDTLYFKCMYYKWKIKCLLKKMINKG